MRLITFTIPEYKGKWAVGIKRGEEVLPIDSKISEDPLIEYAQSVETLAGDLPHGDPIPLKKVSLGPPVLRPSKILAAAANYLDHSQEMAKNEPARTIEEQGFFLKAPSSILPSGGTVILPFSDRRIDFEGELGVIIGRNTQKTSESEALNAVLGYCCLLDITIRGKEDRSYRKSFDTFTPFGPELVTKDEAGPIEEKILTTTINGEIRQQERLSSMIYGVEKLVSWMSQCMTLYPGDVIATGTPKGVGPLSPNDQIELSITGLGTLTANVSAK